MTQTWSYAQLENAWDTAGGPSAEAPTAAAIAEAESGGAAVMQQGQPYSTTGWGPWQITPGNSEPQFGTDNALLQLPNNAGAAVAKYDAAGGFTPWTTYTSGKYEQFMGGAGSGPGGNTGSGGGTGGGTGTGTLTGLSIGGLGSGFFKPLVKGLVLLPFITVGAVMVVWGAARATGLGQAAKAAAPAIAAAAA